MAYSFFCVMQDLVRQQFPGFKVYLFSESAAIHCTAAQKDPSASPVTCRCKKMNQKNLNGVPYINAIPFENCNRHKTTIILIIATTMILTITITSIITIITIATIEAMRLGLRHLARTAGARHPCTGVRMQLAYHMDHGPLGVYIHIYIYTNINIYIHV